MRLFGGDLQILNHLGVKFKAVNVLEDPEVREGIKAFSNWPTIPQLYVKGEFVGGADIVREMFEQEELAPFFEQQRHRARTGGLAARSTSQLSDLAYPQLLIEHAG